MGIRNFSSKALPWLSVCTGILNISLLFVYITALKMCNFDTRTSCSAVVYCADDIKAESWIEWQRTPHTHVIYFDNKLNFFINTKNTKNKLVNQSTGYSEGVNLYVIFQ